MKNGAFGAASTIGRSCDPLERTDYTILSPPYVSATRPYISFVSQSVLGCKNDPSNPTAPVLSTDVSVDLLQSSASGVEAVLISLGSMTHAFDMNQRMVQLEISQAVALDSPDPTDFKLTLEAPEYRWAPPGYYMLLIVDQGIPSKAAMIRLQ